MSAAISKNGPSSATWVALEPRKMAALREHATQVALDGPFFEMAALMGPEAWGNEFYCLVKGSLGPHRDADGRETDLFDGVA